MSAFSSAITVRCQPQLGPLGGGGGGSRTVDPLLPGRDDGRYVLYFPHRLHPVCGSPPSVRSTQ